MQRRNNPGATKARSDSSNQARLWRAVSTSGMMHLCKKHTLKRLVTRLPIQLGCSAYIELNTTLRRLRTLQTSNKC